MIARHRRLAAFAIGGVALAAGVSLAVTAAHAGSRQVDEMSMQSMATASAPNAASGGSAAPAGTLARFAVLTAQHSNFCGLQKQALMRDTDTAQLQGSCCIAMNLPRYQAQVAALRAYRDDPVVPADPYDVSARLAKRLVGYERIVLTTAQRTVYTQAMRQTAEKGPCCCHCWRWDAFSGLSNYLITREGITAAALAQLIGDLDGCGGAA